MQQVEETRVLVFELATGKCILYQTTKKPVYFYHTISAASMDDGTISVRLCGYPTPELVTGENHFMRLELCQTSREARNRIPKSGVFCDVVCNVEEGSVDIQWKDMEQGFEMPVTKYSRIHGPNMEHVGKAHPKYVYAYGTYALGSSEYGDWVLLKLEPDSKHLIATTYEVSSHFFSEPIVVADPDGKEDDDGVILTQMYNGKRGETKLAVLNAKNMNFVAEIYTNNRSPMDSHGGWFPSKQT